MVRTLALSIALWAGIASAWASSYKPTEEVMANHMEKVYELSNAYIVKTFNLVVSEESQFNPVRFNSTGVWGNFQARIKELGEGRFEVQGWVLAKASSKSRQQWSVVIRYPIEDPEAWRYRWLDRDYSTEPEVTSWRFGDYRSVPYDAEYADVGY